MADAMDSKSISRKGVGVRVPSSVPATDPLAAALLPVFLHRLGNTTQLLSTIGSLLSLTQDAGLLAERRDDLAEAAGRAEELGYLLAVLASACGADLLLERREPRGLEIVLLAARDALRRTGRDVALAPQPLPDLAPHFADGWRLPWSVAALIHGAAMQLAQGAVLAARLELEQEHWRLEIDGAVEPALATRTLERLPQARLACGPQSTRLLLPQTALVRA